MDIQSDIVCDFLLETIETSPWRFTVEKKQGETPEVEIFHFHLTSDELALPQPFTLRSILIDGKIVVDDKSNPEPRMAYGLSKDRRTLFLVAVDGRQPGWSNGAKLDELAQIMIDAGDTVENAALQLLNVLFSVPQISMRIGELPPDHRQMLQHYLDFWRAHRDLLLDGALRPYHPELQYPLVTTEKAGEFLAAVYAGSQCVVIPNAARKSFIVNASCETEMLVKLPRRSQVCILDVCGVELLQMMLDGNWHELSIPLSGMAEIIG